MSRCVDVRVLSEAALIAALEGINHLKAGVGMAAAAHRGAAWVGPDPDEAGAIVVGELWRRGLVGTAAPTTEETA